MTISSILTMKKIVIKESGSYSFREKTPDYRQLHNTNTSYVSFLLTLSNSPPYNTQQNVMNFLGPLKHTLLIRQINKYRQHIHRAHIREKYQLRRINGLRTGKIKKKTFFRTISHEKASKIIFFFEILPRQWFSKKLYIYIGRLFGDEYFYKLALSTFNVQ